MMSSKQSKSGFVLLFLLLSVVPLFAVERASQKTYVSYVFKCEQCLESNEIVQAVNYAELADNVYNEITDRDVRIHYINLLNRLSLQCYDKKFFSNALSLSYRGIDYCEVEGYEVPLAELYKTAGNVMNNFGKYDVAHECYMRCLQLAEEQNNLLIRIKVLSNLVVNCSLCGQPAEAHKYFLLMNDAYRHNADSTNHLQPYVYFYTLATILKLDHKYDSALVCFQKAHSLAQHGALPELYFTSCNYEMAVLYDSLSMLDSALYYYQKNVDLAQRYRLPEERLHAFGSLARLYRREGDLGQAYGYQTNYLELSDSLFNADELRRIEQNRYEFINAYNKHKIALLHSSNVWKMNVLALTLLLVILLIIIVLVILKQKHTLGEAYNNLYKFNSELLEFKRLSLQQKQEIAQLKTDLEQCVQESGVMAGEDETVTSGYKPADEQRHLLISKIEHYMSDLSVICHPDFSLEQLAVLIHSNSKYVSQIINDTYHQNFRSFLSEYRIREAQRMLTDVSQYGRYTIQTIGEKVGYRSQSTFIAVFKKQTGLTPSQYQSLSREQDNELL